MKKLTKSNLFTLLGVVIILFTAIKLGYQNTTLAQSPVLNYLSWAKDFPLGYVSIISAVLSVLSTRFDSQNNNLGNWIGTGNIFLAGFIDFALGNYGAIYTYPISFVLNGLSIKTWHDKGKSIDTLKHPYLTTIGTLCGTFVISFGLNYFAYQGHGLNPIFWLSSLVFMLSLVADIMNVLKVPAQWPFWGMYNFVQLAKNISQGNFANVGKYIYYIINSVVSFFTWSKNAIKEKVA